ncbi:galactose oxidase [Backusella circina FSU 941]|nr:galactose oxidase [Backusella circina FSU 941]
MSNNHDNKISSSAGLDLLGSNLLKKNKSIISRVKRSLSANGKPQAQRLATREVAMTTTSMNSNIKIIPEPNYYSMSTPINRDLNISPLPHSHLSYETFASNSASNLSIRSFPVTRRASTNQVFPKRQTADFLLLDKQRSKNIFESRFIENDKIQPLTKLVTNDDDDDDDDVGHAPAPAMYWSNPKTYGTVPPQVRAHASAVFEERMFVFGGSTKSQQCLDTLYTLDLDTFTWSKPRVYGHAPPASRAHCLTVDEKRARLVLFGGGNGHSYHNQLYMLDIHTMTWNIVETQGKSPAERRAHCSVIWHDGLYVFGGGDGKKALSDVHRLDLDTLEWTLITPKGGKKPSSRGYHTGTLVGDKLVIYGGSDGKECFGGCHVLDLETTCWHQVHLDEQLPRLSHTALNIGSFLFIIGGHDGSKYCNDLVMLNLVNMTWETRKVHGQAPAPRGYHTTVLYDSRLFLFGGYDGQSFSNDVYVLELSSYAYLPQIMNFEIDTEP